MAHRWRCCKQVLSLNNIDYARTKKGKGEKDVSGYIKSNLVYRLLILTVKCDFLAHKLFYVAM